MRTKGKLLGVLFAIALIISCFSLTVSADVTVVESGSTSDFSYVIYSDGEMVVTLLPGGSQVIDMRGFSSDAIKTVTFDVTNADKTREIHLYGQYCKANKIKIINSDGNNYFSNMWINLFDNVKGEDIEFPRGSKFYSLCFMNMQSLDSLDFLSDFYEVEIMSISSMDNLTGELVVDNDSIDKLHIEISNATKLDLSSTKATEVGVNLSGNLEELILPDSCKSLSAYNCPSLERIYLPLGFDHIYRGYLDLCNSLTDVYYPGSAAQFNQIKVWDRNYGEGPEDPITDYVTDIPFKNEIWRATVHYYYDSGKEPGWIQNEDGTRSYLYDDGTLAFDWVTIDDKKFFFDNDGIAAEGWTDVYGYTYYFKKNGGYFSDTLFFEGDSIYYFDEYGHMYTRGWLYYGEEAYYFTKAGKALKGWQDISGSTYYFATDGYAVKGWKYQDGLWYFFDDGYRQVKSGWREIDGYWYYFEGCRVTGWKEIDNKKYYFNEVGKKTVGGKFIDDELYYFDEDGVIASGWHEYDGAMYFFDDNGKRKIVTGWQEINGYTYFFNNDGYMVTGSKVIDGVTYNFGTDGRLVKDNGWKTVKNDKYYYVDGVMVTDWYEIEGKWYFFGTDGKMVIGWTKSGNTWYYLESSGVMVTGWKAIGGKWYFFEKSGAMATGWKKSGGEWYYLNPKDGSMVIGWAKSGEDWYYFDSDGSMCTGWVKDNGQWYFLKSGGAMATNEYCEGYWLNANGTWTYLHKASWKGNASSGWWYGDDTGWYAKNETLKIDGTNYTFNSSGYLV